MAKSGTIEPIDISELPSFKKIQSITVDCFEIPVKNCTHYFLSHFHSDHYTRLNKSFEYPVYCSKTTAGLVAMRIGAKAIGLEMYTTYNLGKFYVRLVEANHCPGAVLFIFAFGSDYFLHTGDFRYHPKYHNFRNFKVTFKSIYLDNTYENFLQLPSQKEAISKILSIFDTSGKLCTPNICVLCCTYMVGKEKIFLSVGEYLDKKVQVTEDKMSIYKCHDKYSIEKINHDVLEIVNEKRITEKTFGFTKNLKLKANTKSIQKKCLSKRLADYVTIQPQNNFQNNTEIQKLKEIIDPFKIQSNFSTIFQPRINKIK